MDRRIRGGTWIACCVVAWVLVVRADPAESVRAPLVSAAKMAATPDCLAIDTRSTEDYERGHLPGAIQIPVHEIKTKGFLRGREAVLVGDGFETGALLAAAEQLRGAGFPRLSVLTGGIQAWVDAGSPIEGSSPLHDLRVIPASKVASILAGHRWILVDATTSGETLPASDAASTVRVKDEAALNQLRKTAAAVAESQPAPYAVTALVVADAPGMVQPGVWRGILDTKEIDPYVLDGGSAAYLSVIQLIEKASSGAVTRKTQSGMSATAAAGGPTGCRTCPK